MHMDGSVCIGLWWPRCPVLFAAAMSKNRFYKGKTDLGALKWKLWDHSELCMKKNVSAFSLNQRCEVQRKVSHDLLFRAMTQKCTSHIFRFSVTYIFQTSPHLSKKQDTRETYIPIYTPQLFLQNQNNLLIVVWTLMGTLQKWPTNSELGFNFNDATWPNCKSIQEKKKKTGFKL